MDVELGRDAGGAGAGRWPRLDPGWYRTRTRKTHGTQNGGHGHGDGDGDDDDE